MHAHFEPICEHGGSVWIFTDDKQFGDPYEFILTIINQPGQEAYIRGLRTTKEHPFTQAHKSAVFRCLKAEGYRIAIWDRYKDRKKDRTIVHVL